MAESLTTQVCTAKVMHKRLFPKVNGFTYCVYYLALPLSKLDRLSLPVFANFRAKDHGNRDGSNLREWIDGILQEHAIEADGEVVLIAMPRILGYGFNPVSFWLCFDRETQLRAMLYEVHNTFGQTHSYLCAHSDRRPIAPEDTLVAEKLFHVSPFLPREGEYRFRVHHEAGKRFGVWIDYYAADGQKQLLTAMTGKLAPVTQSRMWKLFFTHPLLTMNVIFLIHWQALRLFIKGIKYIPLPSQLGARLSRNRPD